jgi:hypothetical protein
MTDVTMSETQELAGLSAAGEQLLRELAERARKDGLKLTGEGGLPGQLTKEVYQELSRASFSGSQSDC